MNKKLSEKSNKIALFIIIIVALFITVFGIELLTVQLSQKINKDNRVPVYSKFRHYEIDDSKFRELKLGNEDLMIYTICEDDGCNLKLNSNGKSYYYMITRNDQGYRMNIILDDEIILYDKYLGVSLKKAYFRTYLGYTLFYNENQTEYYLYDYASVVNDNSHVDEFTSLYNNEFEFTDDGIVYYYDVCADKQDGGAQKVKAVRKPFTLTPKVLNVDYVDLSWCKNN